MAATENPIPRADLPFEDIMESEPCCWVTAVVTEAIAIRRGFDNWLPVLWRVLVGRLRNRPPGLRLHARAGPVLETLPGDRSWWTCVEVFGRDCYHLGALSLSDAPTVVDVGANLGAFTLAVRAAWPRANVVSFEPGPAVFEVLRRNVTRNDRYGGNTKLNQEAVTGAKSGPRARLVERAGDLCTSSILCEDAVEPPDHTIEVSARSFGDILGSLGGVDLVKMDVEGAEYDAVCSTEPSLLRTAKYFVIEYHPLAGRSFEELAFHLQAAGFRCWRRERSAIPDQGLVWWERRDG